VQPIHADLAVVLSGRRRCVTNATVDRNRGEHGFGEVHARRFSRAHLRCVTVLRAQRREELDRTPGVVALDRTIFEDAEIFATALHQMRKIDKRDWQTYWGFYQAILNAIKPPDLMIYLRCSMRTLRRRIKLRGRAMEQDVPLAYLKRLDRLYETWINSYDMSEVLVLETDKLDYIHDLVYRLDVMERIESVLPPEFGKPGCH
jgi:deoxyadenosine/deoxycytidine kinase